MLNLVRWCCYPVIKILNKWLEWLKKDWTAPIYTFFNPIPNIDYENGRCFHEFICRAKGCRKRICCYLDKKDARSTSILHKHTKLCWGPEAVEAADQTKDITEACSSVVKPLAKDGSITAIFERVAKGKVSYSHRQHTKTEAKYVPLLTYIYIQPQIQQSRDCPMGRRKRSAIRDCEGSRLPKLDENRTPRILHTIAIHCLARCSNGLFKDTATDC